MTCWSQFQPFWINRLLEGTHLRRYCCWSWSQFIFLLYGLLILREFCEAILSQVKIEVAWAFVITTTTTYCAFLRKAKQKTWRVCEAKQPAIFAMWHASHLVVHHPSLIYNVLYNHRNTFATYTTKKTLRPAQSPSTLAIFHTLQCLIILKTLHILQYKTYR